MGVGIKQMFDNLGVTLKLRLSMDATAGLAMAKRQGLGTAKHICTQYLWVQEKMQNKDIELRNVLTSDN